MPDSRYQSEDPRNRAKTSRLNASDGRTLAQLLPGFGGLYVNRGVVIGPVTPVEPSEPPLPTPDPGISGSGYDSPRPPVPVPKIPAPETPSPKPPAELDCKCEIELTSISWGMYTGVFKLIGAVTKPGPYSIYIDGGGVGGDYRFRYAQGGPINNPWRDMLYGEMRCGDQVKFQVMTDQLVGEDDLVGIWGTLKCTTPIGAAPPPPEKPKPKPGPKPPKPGKCSCDTFCLGIDEDGEFARQSGCVLEVPPDDPDADPPAVRTDALGVIVVSFKGPKIDGFWWAEPGGDYVRIVSRQCTNDRPCPTVCGRVELCLIQPTAAAVAELDAGAPYLEDYIDVGSTLGACDPIPVLITKGDGTGIPYQLVSEPTQDEKDCGCELACGAVFSGTEGEISESDIANQTWDSAEPCSATILVNSRLLMRMQLKGKGQDTKHKFRIFCDSPNVTFGARGQVVEYPNDWPPGHPKAAEGPTVKTQFTCGLPELQSSEAYPCEASEVFVICVDTPGKYKIQCEWGDHVKCFKTVQVAKCLCADFEAAISAGWDYFLQCPEAAGFRNVVEDRLAEVKRWKEQAKAKAQGRDHLAVPFYEITVRTKCIPEEDWPLASAAGWARWQEPNTIEIRCNNDHVPASILFELTNAVSELSHYLIAESALAGDLSKADYVEAIERVEWGGTKLHHELAQKCVDSGKWDAELDRYRHGYADGRWNSFPNYYADMQRDGHTTRYETDWDTIYKKAYDDKHK